MEQTCGSGGGEQAPIPKAEIEAENSQGNYLSSTNPSQFETVIWQKDQSDLRCNSIFFMSVNAS